MARRKTTRKRAATRAASTSRRKSATRRAKANDKFVNLIIPLFLMAGIVSCIGLLLFIGFRTAAASTFFEIGQVETHGTRNVPKEKIEAIVRRHVEGRGIWDADLTGIQSEIARIDYVRSVSVSRVLPKTIRVIVDERRPVALVRIGKKTFRVDRDGKVLDTVLGAGPSETPFLLIGWDEKLSEEARVANKKRLELYLQLSEQWKQYELARRVVAVKLENIRDVEALIMDSGEPVTLSLGNEDFANRLKDGIKHASGNGKRISKIILDDASPVIVYRD